MASCMAATQLSSSSVIFCEQALIEKGRYIINELCGEILTLSGYIQVLGKLFNLKIWSFFYRNGF